MNNKQLEFVMNKLGFAGDRVHAMIMMIIYGQSGYAVEKEFNIPKGTATRDAKKCRDKWRELLRICEDVNLLLEGE